MVNGFNSSLPVRVRRLIDRMNELIAEGNAVAKLERPSEIGPFIQDKLAVNAWLSKVSNIIETTFGAQSSQARHLLKLMPDGPEYIEHSYKVLAIVGLLTGAVDDIEKGYLLKQEFLIAGELFDSLLEQAKYLNKAGYKVPAAVLGRVVLEDAIRRIAKRECQDSTPKVSVINDSLKSAGIYGQPRWRMIQAWLDVGNAAAHGKMDELNEQDVGKMLDGISEFLADDFGQ
jgi:hypothetical protein